MATASGSAQTAMDALGRSRGHCSGGTRRPSCGRTRPGTRSHREFTTGTRASIEQMIPTEYPGAAVRRAASKDAHRLAALSIQVWLSTYATAGVGDALAFNRRHPVKFVHCFSIACALVALDLLVAGAAGASCGAMPTGSSRANASRCRTRRQGAAIGGRLARSTHE